MGLLNRILTFLDSPSADSETEVPSDVAETLIATVLESSKDIDYPGDVFRAFKHMLGFSKGALLLPEKSKGLFRPWITEGLDRTTIRRLRIALDFPPLNRPDSLLVEIEPKDLAPMLSNREFGLLHAPYFVLLGDKASPVALILAVNHRGGEKISSELLQTLQRMNDALSDAIPESRSIMSKADEEADIFWNEWLENWNDDSAVIVILDASDAIDAVMEAIPGLELYRARKDVTGLVRHITGRMGRVFDLKDGRVITVFPLERMPDRDLYLHQLSQALVDAYKKLPSQPKFPAVFLNWPDERKTLNQLLAME